MAQNYSSDLRERIIRFVEAGGSRREAARRFDVSPSFAVKLLTRWRRTGSAAPGRRGGRRSGKLSPHQDFVILLVGERPDITMPELAAELEDKGVRVAAASLSRFLCRLGFSYKKNAVGVGARTR